MTNYRKLISEPQRGSSFEEGDIKAIGKLLRKTSALTRGQEITEFERKFSNLTQTKYSVAVTSCSAALRIAFQILNLSSEDEVIIPANAFWNSVNPILESKAKIKVADVLKHNLTISPKSIEKLITSSTKAILLLDYAGNPCSFKEIKKIIGKRKIILIEDAAHATGSYYNGKHVGNMSDISCFSFSTLKNITTLGEGGMLCTNNKKFADLANKMRNCYPIGSNEKSNLKFGKFKIPKDSSFMRPGDSLNTKWKNVSSFSGRYTMSSVQALVGTRQLRRLKIFLKHRAEIAKIYSSWVNSKKDFKTLNITDKSLCSWHLYVFFISKDSKIKRNEFIKILQSQFKLEVVNRYWPINLNSVMRSEGHKIGEAEDYENHWFKEMVSLPISQVMSINEAKEVVRRLEGAYQKLK